MSHYVRARHYSYLTGNWSTVDPLWPNESAYGYVGGSPISWIDFAGLKPEVPSLSAQLAKCRKKGYGTKNCFECAFAAYRNGSASGRPERGYPGMSPLRACENARAVCKLPNQYCGPCGPQSPKPGLTSGCPFTKSGIVENAAWIREHCGEYVPPLGKPGKVNPAIGADKIAHCYAACCASYWYFPAGWDLVAPKDPDPLDTAAETCGKDIGWGLLIGNLGLFATPPDCLTACAEATNDMYFTP